MPRNLTLVDIFKTFIFTFIVFPQMTYNSTNSGNVFPTKKCRFNESVMSGNIAVYMLNLRYSFDFNGNETQD